MKTYRTPTMEDKRCTKKRCPRPHSWWSRRLQKYFWCWGPYNR